MGANAMTDEEMCMTLRPTFTLTEQTADGSVTMRATWTDLNGRPCSRMTNMAAENLEGVKRARLQLFEACLRTMREGRG